MHPRAYRTSGQAHETRLPHGSGGLRAAACGSAATRSGRAAPTRRQRPGQGRARRGGAPLPAAEPRYRQRSPVTGSGRAGPGRAAPPHLSGQRLPPLPAAPPPPSLSRERAGGSPAGGTHRFSRAGSEPRRLSQPSRRAAQALPLINKGALRHPAPKGEKRRGQDGARREGGKGEDYNSRQAPRGAGRGGRGAAARTRLA